MIKAVGPKLRYLSNRQRRIKNWDIPISLGPLKDKVEERKKKNVGEICTVLKSNEY